MVADEKLEDTVVVDAAREVAPILQLIMKKWWWGGVENVADVCVTGICSAAAFSADDDNFAPRKLIFEVQGNYSFSNDITV